MGVLWLGQASVAAQAISHLQVRDCFRLPGPKSLAWCFHVESLLLWWAQGGGPGDRWLPSARWRSGARGSGENGLRSGPEMGAEMEGTDLEGGSSGI